MYLNLKYDFIHISCEPETYGLRRVLTFAQHKEDQRILW